MIVIFIGQIATGADVFDLCAFLLAVLVVILVRIYGLAGKVGLGFTTYSHYTIDIHIYIYDISYTMGIFPPQHIGGNI